MVYQQIIFSLFQIEFKLGKILNMVVVLVWLVLVEFAQKKVQISLFNQC